MRRVGILSGRAARIAGTLLCLMPCATPLSAATPSSLELTDGSIVIGEVLGMRDGVYRVRTAGLGTLNIDSSRIRSIRQSNAVPADPATAPMADPATDYRAEVAALQRQLVGDGDLMQMIVGLANDPALQRALADPRLLGSISSGDIEAIRAHPSVRELMSHPRIREILERVQAR